MLIKEVDSLIKTSNCVGWRIFESWEHEVETFPFFFHLFELLFNVVLLKGFLTDFLCNLNVAEHAFLDNSCKREIIIWT